jgi:hypothetical protein
MNQRRPAIAESGRLRVWGAAAGRCTFCNRSVLENEDLGEVVPIGELAHAVGWSSTSPRGTSDLTETERAAADNLVLLCRNCHKPIDAKGVVDRYSVEVLLQLKREHEARVRFLTDIGADRKTHVVRVVGAIRGVQPELSYDSVLEATTDAGLFPATLDGAYGAEVELDLRQQPDDATSEGFTQQARQIDTLAARVHDGVRRGDVARLAVFGLARIPALVYLGAQLDDKIETHIFQRQRTDDGHEWRWPRDAGPPSAFAIEVVPRSGGATLILNLSGTIPDADVPSNLHDDTWYVVSPASPNASGPAIIDSPGALANFEQTVRDVLARVERDHGRLETISVLAAIPVSAAITLGRTLMPNVSPSLTIFDRDDAGQFFRALEVRR